VNFTTSGIKVMPVACLLKARNVKTEKQPLLGNACIICNNEVTVGSSVSCAVHAELYDDGQVSEHIRHSPVSSKR
jgi:hypothetical protein